MAEEIKLDVACGDAKLNDYIGIDKCKGSDADIILDVTKEVLPYKDDSVDEIFIKHALEHFEFEGIVFLMNEFWRTLKPGHTLHAIVPHREGKRAWVLTHKTYWDEDSFRFFEEERSNLLYSVKLWKIIELVTNQRLDTHCKMIPIKDYEK